MPRFPFFPLWGRSSALRKELKSFEKNIHYCFHDLTLLKRALTHKSFVNESRQSALEQNERYEFLGDAVLELTISHLLMEYFPEFSEGDLSKLRAAVVNEGSLAELARALNLGAYLYLGRGEEQCEGRKKDSLLADAFEAVLGAIYLDGGFSKANAFVISQFTPLLKKAQSQDIIKDYKTRLQEESQTRFRSIPRYKLISELGPDHDKTFEIHLLIHDKIYGKGQGKSKKQAEQEAAKEALQALEAGLEH
ncbi:MAG: ribonuclease III [Deltaproteobacteria bacterium RIFCSPLOWO2_12_FULL_40_28]|nr:MAG: ribonuclease III [Deltaproteobacteria bacterium RIFCSPHIGHO2_02_FULL_40_28]OGQ20587.1 MAG: ribonuclease III [Deltaproteobacteria bacterium RIFCSPHIGHO2_12_FULL_40_32]OGQ41143.1 MAG: ribonuclease III [Deltaproteobacteria bacterium RIFCSPLOWO2_02_FULL_40_36]OGQ55165.1 MAG: ribonuclease III [Deltaproteobacteria bacterium RIFCSPLOWO2_12_FULL_40_28]